VTEFIDDMAAAYAWADVVVCRSGALTVSEIAAAGPALFVPFQHKDRQQYWNALPLEKAGAAKILNSHNLPLMRSPPPWRAGIGKRLLDMAERARGASIPDATERVAEEVSAVALAR
jgi:UDP-N-acetylglucosamine--N-acetylmuramyl-(pentapeptide) pyrophosphoryl-undecaprenol N-acetylglucosamine transferase